MKQKDYENLRETGRTVELYECQNCGFEDEYENLPAAKDVAERHTPGDTFSDVECPECGSLCFPVEEKCPQFGFVSLQADEDEGEADCGCKMVRAEANTGDPAFFLCPMHGVAPEMLEALKYIDSVAPCQPGDGSAPLEDGETVEIVITGKALKDLRAAIAKATEEQ